jgi:hypothetical protein
MCIDWYNNEIPAERNVKQREAEKKITHEFMYADTVNVEHEIRVCTYLFTYSIGQSPSWKANRFSANQEIPRLLSNPKLHYRIDKCPPPVPILSQLDAVQTPTPDALKIHLSIIISSTPGSSNWSLPFRFPNQNPVYTSPVPHKCYMPRPSHSSRFWHPNNIGWEVKCMFIPVMIVITGIVTKSLKKDLDAMQRNI